MRRFLEARIVGKPLVLEGFWVSGSHNCSKTIGFIRFLGFWRPELLENHWFYKVSGFLETEIIGKPLVL